MLGVPPDPLMRVVAWSRILGLPSLMNALLRGLVAIQHSVMARPTFKKAWTKVIPESIRTQFE